MPLPKLPVSAARIKIASEFGLENVDAAARACRKAGLPFAVACALLEQESGGRNVYGHDVGGALAGYPRAVNRDNFAVFRWMVLDRGMTANGVGPCQITYAGTRRANGTRDGGYFRQMDEQGLRPWVAEDNMQFGFALLRAHYESGPKSWAAAGTRYNGSPSYGADLAAKVAAWKLRLRGREVRR